MMPRMLHAAGLITLPLFLALAGCAAEPTIQSGEDAETIMGTLNKVDNSTVDMAYVDPQGDYARYERVYVAPLNLDNVEIIQPDRNNSMLNRYNSEWELTDANREQLQTAFQDVMERELTKDGAFAIADSGGDDVIVIEAMLTAIAPTAPKDDMGSRTTGRSRVYTESAGSISIAIAFADGDSGEVLALIKDTRSGQTGTWGLNNSVTNMAEVRRSFGSWASRVREGLLGLKARAATP
jgi:uncharacterized lipoprotein YajG